MASYDHKKIEKKWQKAWEETGAAVAHEDSNKKKFYGLIEFPYPSGAGMHVGHIRSNTAMDIIARKRRAEGNEVLYPIGWDAFGLPTENYAVKTGIHPAKVTQENTDNFRRQLKELGFSFDWSREINTTDPAYYKWTQWIFIQMFKKGLAYKAKSFINWCPSCKIGLANEEAIGGICERCGGPTEKREKEQWMLAITKYADRLDKDLDEVDYLEKIKIQQRNWIGRSEGINITYHIEGQDESVTVFTTRPDTNFGATFVVAGPDSAFVANNIDKIPHAQEVREYCRASLQKSEIERLAEGKKKTGVFTGWYAINQLNGKKLPVYVGDFVLGTVGTGVVVGVPGHDVRDFEFAEAMGIEVVRVVVGTDGDTSAITRADQVQEKAGVMINSDFLDGMDIHAATQEIMVYLEKKGWGVRVVNYKLRDWVFSRQRYWGEPIPLVHCDKEGWVAVPDEALPVVLPDVKEFKPRDDGQSPLASVTDWVNTTCPQCGGPGKRETDTMPNWAGSSWYYLRYMDPGNDNAFVGKDKVNFWQQVDWYNGGMEHTTLHLLYSRFWHKFLFDLGLVPTSEPYQKRTSHGLILAHDGSKMSKSKGNVVNPDELVEMFGADALRLYEMFMGPFDQPISWNTDGVVGTRRFLERIIRFSDQKLGSESVENADVILHQTIKKVSDDIEDLKMNTAVSALMILLNAFEKDGCSAANFKIFLRLLAPFAPHLTEELWEKVGEKGSVHAEPWPEYDVSKITAETVKIMIQINGKTRGSVELAADAPQDAVESAARAEVADRLAGDAVQRVIFVPNRLINFVKS